MKRFFSQLAGGLVLAASAGAASAAFVTLIEGPLEGSPITVSTNLISSTGGAPSITADAEHAVVSGFHTPLLSPSPVASGVRSAGLYEPGTQQLSDLVILEAGDVGLCDIPGAALISCQSIIVTFYSDQEGAPPLESLIPAGSFQGALVETGGLQDLSVLLGSVVRGEEGLRIQVQSDVELPEPSLPAMVAVALLALGWTRRRLGSRA